MKKLYAIFLAFLAELFFVKQGFCAAAAAATADETRFDECVLEAIATRDGFGYKYANLVQLNRLVGD